LTYVTILITFSSMRFRAALKDGSLTNCADLYE